MSAAPNDVVTSASSFLKEAARYFETRPTDGEDRAFYSNFQNAENCRKAANTIEQQAARIAELEADKANLKLELDTTRRELMSWNAMAIDLEGKLAKAREVVRPFAECTAYTDRRSAIPTGKAFEALRNWYTTTMEKPDGL